MADGAPLKYPETPEQWRIHTRMLHGTWLTPATPVEEYWEFHTLDHAHPGSGCVPHTHIAAATADAGTDHGFW